MVLMPLEVDKYVATDFQTKEIKSKMYVVSYGRNYKCHCNINTIRMSDFALLCIRKLIGL